MFGCWNEGGCKNNDNLRGVVNELLERNDDYAFGIIAGDNIYPTKPTKVHDVKILEDGVQCLNQIGVPLYVALGNHDVSQCDIINYHKSLTMDYKEWKFPSNYYTVRYYFDDEIKVNLIFIDTNLSMYPSCSTNVTKESKKEMFRWLKEQMSQEADHIVVVGHAPLVSCKKGSFKVLDTELLDVIASENKKIYYLCADTHNFQHLSVDDVEVVVAGTGGAHPDPISEEMVGQCYLASSNYSIKVLDFDTSYGFCEATIGKKEIAFEYVKI